MKPAKFERATEYAITAALVVACAWVALAVWYMDDWSGRFAVLLAAFLFLGGPVVDRFSRWG